MPEKPGFVNVLFSQRTHLTPQESMHNILKYALIQDARQRSRRLNANRGSMVAALLLFGPPAYYVVKGTFDGCWGELHPDNKFGFTFGAVGKSTRLLYRPELYYRDNQLYLYEVEKQVIATEKAGEKPKILSPLVLWQ